jgi:amidophosphoribosyltransferase
MVDDSIVRGTTTGSIVRLLRDAGAKAVHVRISSPSVRFPCHYGVDMCSMEELIAHRLTLDEIRDHIGADSLGYLSAEGLLASCGPAASQFCTACFTSDYPIPVPDESLQGKLKLDCSMDHVEDGADDALGIAMCAASPARPQWLRPRKMLSHRSDHPAISYSLRRIVAPAWR